jgi:hypothetical protein
MERAARTEDMHLAHSLCYAAIKLNPSDNIAVAGPLPNLRWERFAREYASGESLARAYVRAGFADTPNARFNASRLSHKPEVRTRINELMEQFAEASAVKLEYLQHQLLPMVRVNSQYLFQSGTDKLQSIANMPREVAAAIKSIKFDKETGKVIEITLADKIAAAGMLLRSIGALRDDQGKTIFAILQKKMVEWTDDDFRLIESRLMALEGGQPDLELDTVPG